MVSKVLKWKHDNEPTGSFIIDYSSINVDRY